MKSYFIPIIILSLIFIGIMPSYALTQSECNALTNLSSAVLEYTVVTCDNPFNLSVNMGQRLHIQNPSGGSANMLPSASYGNPGTYQYSSESTSGTIKLQNQPNVGISFENVQVSFSGSQMSVSGNIVNSNSFPVKNLYVYWHVTDSSGNYLTSWQRYGNDGQAYGTQIPAQSTSAFSETVCCLPSSGASTATPYIVQAFREDGTKLISTSTQPTQPTDGSFTLPCSMQEKGDGVSSSSCNGVYENGIAKAKVGIQYNSGLFPIKNYKSIGFFIDKNGNQGQNIQVTLDQIKPGESQTMTFANTIPGFVSQFKMQMLGGDLVTEPKSVDTVPPTITTPSNISLTTTNPSGITVTYAKPTATDNIGVVSGPTCNPTSGSTFQIGTTTVTCTASDATGNIGSTTFTVTVTKQSDSLPTDVTVEMAKGSATDTKCGVKCFVPNQVSVAVGGTVTWKNVDTAAHTATDSNGAFDSSLIMAKGSFKHKFDTAGTYNYMDLVHPWMTGVVYVGQGNPVPPTNAYSSAASVMVNGIIYKVKYYAKGLTVDGLEADTDTATLSVFVSKVKTGSTLQITLDRNFFDSKTAGSDDDFLILADGIETAFQESKDNVSRTLTINVPEGKPELDIIALGSTGFDSEPVSEQPEEIPTEEVPEEIPEEITCGPGTVFDNGVCVLMQTEAEVSIPVGSSSPGCETTNECYIPHTVTISVGGEVTWTNDDTAAHTVTSGNIQLSGPDGRFDSGLLPAGKTFSHKFNESGEFSYFCAVHPWMTGVVYVGQGNPNPSPIPSEIGLYTATDKSDYDLGELVALSVNVVGISSPQNVAFTVTDPFGTIVVSRTLTTDSSGNADTNFKIAESFKTGTYHIDATTSVNGITYSDTSDFKVTSQFNQIQIVSAQGTDQQGNQVSFTRGNMGFVKVQVSAEKSIATLITVNVFDSDLTPIGVGSLKTTLSPGQSELILSFLIPKDAVVGTADIYVNALSDWVSSGGIPQTGEFAGQVGIN